MFKEPYQPEPRNLDSRKELLRMYRVFTNRGFNEKGKPLPDTFTVVLSDQNQAYSTWTRDGKPSVAPLRTSTNSTRWKLESRMNVLGDGRYMTPSEFRESLERTGFRIVRARDRKFTALEQQESRQPNPEAWSSLAKYNKIYRFLK